MQVSRKLYSNDVNCATLLAMWPKMKTKKPEVTVAFPEEYLNSAEYLNLPEHDDPKKQEDEWFIGSPEAYVGWHPESTEEELALDKILFEDRIGRAAKAAEDNSEVEL